MAFTGIVTKSVAALAVGLAGASGVETVIKYTSPPPIEGYGDYADPVRAGETIPINWVITKRIDCPGVVSRTWYGENGFYLVEAARPSGLPTSDEAKSYNVYTEIPSMAPSGELKLSIRGEYHCESGLVLFELGPAILEILE